MSSLIFNSFLYIVILWLDAFSLLLLISCPDDSFIAHFASRLKAFIRRDI